MSGNAGQTDENIVGIDLGTTNSVVARTDSTGISGAIAGEDGARVVASCVYFPKEAGAGPIVGAMAKQMSAVEPERVAQLFKRGMGEKVFQADGQPFSVDGQVWSPEELSSLVLKKLKSIAEVSTGKPVTKAVITVPAYFGEPERKATQDAGELAGLEVLRIVNEPTAAAIAHGLDERAENGLVMVFDLGGGTFDVTVMELGEGGDITVKASGGDHHLGGADFDNMILKDMVATVQRENGVNILNDPWALSDAVLKAEEIKKELSGRDKSTRALTGAGKPVAYTLERAKFESMLQNNLEEIEDHVLNTCEQAGINPTDVDTILLVGGSSRIPAMKDLLKRLCGKDPIFSKNLDEDVARGAAILATKLGGEVTSGSSLANMPVPKDAASHGLGISVKDDDGKDINQLMLKAGDQVPCQVEARFVTYADSQREINVVLNEGDSDDLDLVRPLGDAVGKFGKAVDKGHPVVVRLEYTADQRIKVTALDGESNTFLCDLDVAYEGNMSANEKADALAYLDGLEVE